MNAIRHSISYLCTCLLACVILTVSCQKPSVPSQAVEATSPLHIYPDYIDVTIPCNIAPLNFAIEHAADAYVTRLTAGEREVVIEGASVQIDAEEWNALKKAAKEISVEVYILQGGKWSRFKPFHFYVSQDKIDPYLTYRLIAPSYVTYESLTLNQRCLETFEERLIYGNMLNANEKEGHCINCHTSQAGNPQRTHFHVRHSQGGTVINYDGKIRKVELKVPGTISSGVYPAWHPTLDLIAYSTNHTGQSFHTYDRQKIEVQDTYSDLILYDLQKNEVTPLTRDSNNLECFPAWDAKGEYLYYCSAHYERKDSTGKATKDFELMQNYDQIHYNLYRRAFHAQDHSFGPEEMVYDCADTCSATLPRISPDGKYLLFTRGKYGVFHIWHNTSDLYMTDLKTGQTRCLDEVNSNDTESYHSWSTQGKWIVFSSRRYDGNFTRPFFAHLNPDGTFTKPFELPQQNPRYHQYFLRSYNVPEFLTGPITLSPQEFAKAIRGEAQQATEKK